MKFVKKFVFFASTVAAVLSLSTSAQAAIIPTVTDTVTSDPDKIVSLSTSVNFDHIFTDQGFILGVTKYINGVLNVRLTDAAAGEEGVLRIGNQTKDVSIIQNNTQDDPSPEGSFYEIILNEQSLADLNADGRISVRITSTSGNFYFADSSLTVTPTQVPEPMSLAILGAGLLGIGAVRGRRAAK